jgi:radical SAM superfamily enzyme YgiQ (UPF0313 family)
MLFKNPLLVAIDSRYTHSNPAVFCIKNYLKSVGKEISLLEFNINGKLLDMLQKIVKKQPDLIGFSCYIWNYEIIITLSKMLKKVLPECKILLGGPQVNGIVKDILQKYPEIDYIIEGEGEKAWEYLLDISSANELKSVPNLRYKIQKDNLEDIFIIENQQSDFIDLSNLPFYYDENDLQNLKNRIIYYESSRGCPFGCKFCLSAQEPIRYRDLAKVKADLKKLTDCGCKKIKFVDRTFNSNPKRAKEILEYLLSIYRENICFHLELEPMCLSEDLIDLLLTAPPGYFQAEIGVQSLYEPALKAVGRRPLADNAVSLIKKLIAAENMHIHLDLIAGLPYETLADFKDSFNGVFEILPHYLQLGFLKILPGTPLADLSNKYGLIFVDKPPYQVLMTPWLSYENMCYLSFVEYAVDNYYNEAFFEKTLSAAMVEWKKFGKTPFEFFYCLGKTDKNIEGGKSQSQKGKVLFDLLSEYFPSKILLWKNALKLDFILNKINPPSFLGDFDEMSAIKNDENLFLEKLPMMESLPRRQWLKHFKVFVLEINVDEFTSGLYVADMRSKHGIWQRPQLILIKS